jgi:SAM-dependent methyltransferase
VQTHLVEDTVKSIEGANSAVATGFQPQLAAFIFACPRCRAELEFIPDLEARCPVDGGLYRKEQNIWRFIPPERTAYYERFIREYETVRLAEGRGAQDAAWYRALPFADLSNRMSTDWNIRSRSFKALLQQVIIPLENHNRGLNILDLGAGNGWLSNRLAQRGHHLAAVDLLTNQLDGLGAAMHYENHFTLVQAEYDHLPFADAQADLLIFNASFHYSTSYIVTLREARRLLKPGGKIILLDTPVYRRSASGDQMVHERQETFRRLYGFPSNALPSENYLTDHRIRGLGAELNLSCLTITPFYGLRWWLRPWLARLRGRREPARFQVIVYSAGN